MKVSDLTGAQLDAWVAKAEGVTGLVEKDGRMCHVEEWDPEGHSWRDSLKDWVMWIDYAPSQRWDQGGPLIERERMQLMPWKVELQHIASWTALTRGKVAADGDTPLIAAMRAFVASKFGEDLEEPQ